MPRGQNFIGKKPENSGVKKGSKNAKTLAWEQLGESLVGAGAERAIKIIQEGNDVTFLKFYPLLLEYFKPKLQRSDITSTVTNLTAQDVLNELKED